MRTVFLKDIATLITKGTTPTSLGYNFTDAGINFVKIESINEEGYFITEKFAHISDECNEKLNRSILQANDILFSIAGAIGRTAIVKDDILPANTNQALAIIRIPQGIYDYEFLRYVLQSPAVTEQFERKKQGVAQLNLSLKDVGELSIPIVELDEQKKIIDVLKKVSDLIALRKQQLAKLDSLVKARFVELTESTNAVPTRMGDIATYINGYAFKPTQWEESGLPIIRIQNLNDHNAPYNYYSGELADKFLIRNGDVLVSWATHLEAYVWNGQEAWLNQHIFKVVFDKMAVNKIYYVYACEEALRQAFRNAHGFKPTMEHIKKADFDDAIVKLPDMHTQERFATFVEQTDKSKSEIQTALTKLETLKKALMQQYFG